MSAITAADYEAMVGLFDDELVDDRDSVTATVDRILGREPLTKNVIVLDEPKWHRAASFVADDETSDAEAGTFEFVDAELIERIDEGVRWEALWGAELEWVGRCEVTGKVDERCGEREFLAQQLGQARVDVEVLVVQAMAATGMPRAKVMKFAQVQRAVEHGVALREAFNYRSYCTALGWTTYKRIAFKRRHGTFERANRELRRLALRRNARAAMRGEELVVPALVASRLRRRYPLGTGGTHLRQAA